MIIEFYGLPGSGKSTVSDKVADDLTRKGYKVLKNSDYYKAGTRKSLMCKALRTKTGRSFCLKAVILVIKNGLLFRGDVFKRMVSCLSFLGYYNVRQKECDCLVLDEGIVQNMVSALYTYNKGVVDFKNILSVLSEMDLMFVYIDADVAMVSERISRRKTYGHGRCDGIMDVEERKRVLFHQKENFNRIYSSINEVFYSTKVINENRLFECVEEITKMICQNTRRVYADRQER